VVTVPPLAVLGFCPTKSNTASVANIPDGYAGATVVPPAAEYAAAPGTGGPKAPLYSTKRV